MHWLNAGHPDAIPRKVLLQGDETLQEDKSCSFAPSLNKALPLGEDCNPLVNGGFSFDESSKTDTALREPGVLAKVGLSFLQECLFSFGSFFCHVVQKCCITG